MHDTGISVLIPVYNFEISSLVNQLYRQFSAQQILFEIKVYDDCSTDDSKLKNKEVSALSNVVYRELPHNLGRSRIRNLLASESQYENLLFLDCDNQVVIDNYVSKYINYLKYYHVLIGGTRYASKPPADKSHYLHWYVGRNKEEFNADKRNIRPYESVTLNNMLIRKPIYMDVLLDETITTYGHEDSKFGEELKNRKYNLVHIDNPIRHIGLNTNTVFLEKSLQAVDNLYLLISKQDIGRDTKLYKTYLTVKKFHMAGITHRFLNLMENSMYKNLISSKPSLILFDLYKLNRLLFNFKNMRY